jgi:tetratricopeptide (TPR) repeat protein
VRHVLGLVIVVVAATAVAAAETRENIACRSDPTQTYTLFLPSGYEPSKRVHPLLLVFDPRRRGTRAAEIFMPAAEQYGWIIISSNETRSDETNEPNERAVRALFAELDRYAVDPRRVYAAGFSGTAIMAWSVAITTGRLAGVIGVGGRFIPEIPPAHLNVPHYGFAGIRDFNQREMRMFDAGLGERIPHRFQSFDADHRWITPALAREALGWFEVLAGKHVESVYAEDVKAAEALQGLAALRRWREIQRTYKRDFSATITALEKDPAVQRELSDEKRWDQFEAEYLRDTLARMPWIVAQPDVTKAFGIPDLKRRVARGGSEGAAAQRLLEAVYAQTAFSLRREFYRRGQYARAANVLKAAVSIHPDRQDAWYNLAAAHAKARQWRPAYPALEKLIALGFRDAQRLAADEDFAALRGERRFQDLLALASPSQ